MLRMERGKHVHKVRNVGLFGGTFDPIHTGHIALAKSALQTLQLDEVLLVVAANPSFKLDSVCASVDDRLQMCRLACEGEPNISVCDIESKRPGVSYTIDTLVELKQMMPDASFTFLIGIDAASDLHRWHDSERLAKLAKFRIFRRLSFEGCEASLLASLQYAGFDVEYVKAPTNDVSSSSVRQLLCSGQDTHDMLCPKVKNYISKRGLYMGDSALSQAFYDARKSELKNRVSEHRFKHIEGVSETAGNLAKVYGADVKCARLAGLLHDWDKGLCDDEIRARVYELGIADEVGQTVIDYMPQVLHGPTAAKALQIEFPQIPQDVINAIKYHTTASMDPDDLQKIIYISDAIEPERKFDDADKLRAMVGKVSLDELFFEVYKLWTVSLLQRNKVLHPDTMTIWNMLAMKCSTKKGHKEVGKNA